jgi:plastocyanin
MPIARGESTITKVIHFSGILAMKKSLAASLPVVALVSFFILSGCTKASTSPYGATSAPPPVQAQPNTVVIANIAFGPAALTVKAGTTVTWQNNDGIAHTSTSDTGVWDTGTISPGASKSVVFNTAGTFPYHCTVHPMMTATITVTQ